MSEHLGFEGPGASEGCGVFASLGAAVRVAREAAGLTVEQVSARTKIRAIVLRDLEDGSTARCGGAAYARGHLRAIATATGADPAVLLAAHDDAVREAAAGEGALERSAPTTSVQVHALTGALGLPKPTRERGRPRWGVAAAGAALVLSALLLVGVLYGADDRASPPRGDTVAAPRMVPSSAAPAAPAAASSASAPVPLRPSGAALRLQVDHDTSWVSVLTAGGKNLFTGMLSAGSARDFNDPSRLSVIVGNAGAVTVACAGTEVAAGSPGQVRRYTCAPDGLAPA